MTRGGLLRWQPKSWLLKSAWLLGVRLTLPLNRLLWPLAPLVRPLVTARGLECYWVSTASQRVRVTHVGEKGLAWQPGSVWRGTNCRSLLGEKLVRGVI